MAFTKTTYLKLPKLGEPPLMLTVQSIKRVPCIVIETVDGAQLTIMSPSLQEQVGVLAAKDSANPQGRLVGKPLTFLKSEKGHSVVVGGKAPSADPFGAFDDSLGAI